MGRPTPNTSHPELVSGPVALTRFSFFRCDAETSSVWRLKWNIFPTEI